MPYYYFDLVKYPTTETINMISFLLEKIVKTNDCIKPTKAMMNTQYVSFYAKAVPSISIRSYLGRILKYCPCPNECFLSLLIYFDRLARAGLRIDSFNIHRLIITGIMVASKFFSDTLYTNARYAKVGGLDMNELNLLELHFLKLNNFRFNIPVEELQEYGNQLLTHCIVQQTNYIHHSSHQKQLCKSH